MKKLLALVIISVALPFTTSAVTIDELQAQLQTLMAQIAGLQQAQTGAVLGVSNCPNLTRTLVLRSTGDDVVQLQKFLITNRYLASGYDTGFFGSLTEVAVKKFQCEKMKICSGSTATSGYGAVGPKTRTVVAQVCSAASIPFSTTQTPTPTTQSVAPTQTISSAPLTASLPSFTMNPNNPRFNSLWLEPDSLSFGRNGQITSADLRAMVREYKQMGIGTVVVAYTEHFDSFLFTPQQNYSFYSYSNNVTVSSMNPNQRRGLLSDGDFLGVLLDESSKQGMKVILGLSNGGDPHLTIDLYAKVKNGQTTYVPETVGKTLNDRIMQATNIQVAVAKDLAAQYGSYSALQGWYIPHEESECLDTGNNLYTGVATALKAATPGKIIMLSPTVDVKVCFNAQTYAQAVTASKADIIAYQDGLGSGYRRINGIGQNLYTEAARDARRTEITPILQGLKAAHGSAGAQFWINTELWRMDGTCPSNGGYGCSFPGDWTSAKKQLFAWSAIAPGNLMMNEGFLNFDFGIERAKLSNSAHQALAGGYTTDYRTYLASSQPVIPPAPIAPTATISASPTSVVSGNGSVVSWTCSNATKCQIYTNGLLSWDGGGSVSSSAFDTGPLTQNTTYYIKATNSAGVVATSPTIAIAVTPPPVSAAVVAISASPTSVATQGQSTITWSAQNAASCSLSTNGGVPWYTGSSVFSSAFMTGALTSSSTYTLTCSDAAGIPKSISTTVTVQ